MENLSALSKAVTSYLGLIFKVGLSLVILSTLFLFTNLTTEMFDTPKLLVVLIFTGLLLILTALRFTLTDRVTFLRTSLDIPFLLLLAVGVVSLFLSSSPYVALLGNQFKINGSLVSLAVLILFYFVLVNNLQLKTVKWFLNLTVFAGVGLAVLSLLTFFGVKILPSPWQHGINFTTTGSSFSTTAILSLIIPFIVVRILSSSKPLFIILNSLFLFITGLTIALTGSWPTWIAALLGLALALVLSNLQFQFTEIGRVSSLKSLRRVSPLKLISLAAPLVLVAGITVFSLIPPIGEAENPLYTQSQNFPREIQLGFKDSWKIAVSAFRDLPFWGTGPATFAFDFTNYKPIEFNSSKFWNLRFDSAFNEYLQVLATLGGVGLVALMSLTALFISAAYRTIISHSRLARESIQMDSHLPHKGTNFFEVSHGNDKVMLAISGLVFFVLLALHPATFSLWIIGLFILAAFMAVNFSEHAQKSWINTSNIKSTFFRITGLGGNEPSRETFKIDALPGILLTISIVAVLAAGYFGAKFVLADYYHRLALNAVSQNQGIIAYNNLVLAEKLNPYNDTYRTDLAQTNFALANAIAAAKAPSEASPAGSLTDQDKQNIQVLLQQSIAEARTAVTLSPKSAVNWEILALLYRQIAGVAQNALIFSLDAYGRAIFQDPLNPSLRLNVGGVYYAVSNFDTAIRFFTDSINLKPDFANGYYNLSVALRDKGDLTNAVSVAEKLLTLVDQSSPDYNAANDYLNDLKNRIASGSAQESAIQPPAAQASGSLQKEELPKVVDVGNPPEKIATPSAVKKADATPTPAPTPTKEP